MSRGRPTKRDDLRAVKRECAQSHADLAYQRTLALLHNFHLMNHDLKALLASAYLQGVEDTCLTFFAKPELVKQG